MAKSQYKIAIMGGTKVGKTMFLGSYFHLALDLGEADYAITKGLLEKDDEDRDAIDRLIRQIFVDGSTASSTSERANISFSVDSLGMDIELWDVQGGLTTSASEISKGTGEISEDLKNADGVIYFIPANELYYNAEEVNQANRTFIDSITLIRQSAKGRYADIPIWFVFTKCDMLPEDVTQDELVAKMKGLFNKASEDGDKIFKKGKNVKFYMSRSMGIWRGEHDLPEVYAPENVHEPMDEMFEAMKRARRDVSRIILKAACVLVLIVFAAIFGGAYYYDSSNGRAARSEVQGLIQKNDFASALKVLDEFKTPWGIDRIIPDMLKASNGINALRTEVYTAWESNLYSKIKPAIDGASNMNDRVRADIQAYLDNTEFPQIAPEHYKNISGIWRADRDAKELKDKIDEIKKARSLETLFAVYGSLDKLRSHTDVAREISDKIKGIVADELQSMKTYFDNGLAQGDYTEVKIQVSRRCGDLRLGLQKFQDNSVAMSSIADVDSMERDSLARLRSAHFEYCKQQFSSRRGRNDKREVQACIDALNEYPSTWPDASSTNDGSQVRQVLAFLGAIRDGVNGTLRINGDFSAIKSTFDTPDMKLYIYIDGSWIEKDTIDDNVSPSWSHNMKWHPGMSDLSFRCEEMGVISKNGDVIISDSINASGFTGFQNLNRTLSGQGCSLSVRFETNQSIPSCPW